MNMKIVKIKNTQIQGLGLIDSDKQQGYYDRLWVNTLMLGEKMWGGCIVRMAEIEDAEDYSDFEKMLKVATARPMDTYQMFVLDKDGQEVEVDAITPSNDTCGFFIVKGYDTEKQDMRDMLSMIVKRVPVWDMVGKTIVGYRRRSGKHMLITDSLDVYMLPKATISVKGACVGKVTHASSTLKTTSKGYETNVVIYVGLKSIKVRLMGDYKLCNIFKYTL